MRSEVSPADDPLDAQLARMEGDRDSLESERMRLELRTRLFGDAAAPTRIDRFIVLRRLGAGGMGVVYAAYDPQLQRNVALKLVRAPDPATWASHQQRLLREARTLARLSHPHVIAVFEAGTHGRDVFIAMELVEGATLDAYCRAVNRTRSEIVSVYLQAGEGLAAAHEADLVHRDFKPQNVLVGDDARVRVLDFGLARMQGDTDNSAEPASARDGSSSLTAEGNVLGTPAYMAPEQRVGSSAIAASDQFAFCVALHESLAGSLPRIDFAAEAAELARRGLPRRIRNVLARGLAIDPARRWPSMRVLLRELRRATNVRRFAIAGLLASGVGVAIATAIVVRDESCPDARGELDGAWDEARAAQLERAVNWDDGRLARDTARLTIEHLDVYADGWVDAKAQACRAHHEDRAESAELFDAKMVCLKRRRGALVALVEVLLGADETTSRKAVEASLALPRVEDCLDNERLLARVAPPDDPATAASVEQLRAELDRANALSEVGRIAEARTIAESVLEQATALAYRPLQAEAARVQSAWLGMLGDGDAAWAAMRDAAWYAEAGGDDESLALALANLVRLETRRDAHERAHETARRTEAAIERLGHASLADYALHEAQGELARAEERFADAVAHHEAELQWARDREPGSPREAEAMNNLAVAVYDGADYDRARELFAASLEQQRESLGELHPFVLGTRTNLAAVLERQGKLSEAAAMLEEVIAGLEQAGAEDRLAGALANLGQVEVALGRPEQAIAHAELAVAITTKTAGPQTAMMIAPENALGMAYLAAGRRDDARRAFEQVGRIAEAVGHREGQALASTNVAAIDLEDGRPEAAARLLRGAIETWSELHGADHPAIGEMTSMLAQAELDLGQLEAARASIERAVELLGAGGGDTPPLAEARGRREAIVAAQAAAKEQ